MGLASLLTGAAAAVRIIFSSDAAAPGPARKLPKTLDQGLGSVQRLQPGADVLQPCQIGLARLLAQGQLGILLFPK